MSVVRQALLHTLIPVCAVTGEGPLLAHHLLLCASPITFHAVNGGIECWVSSEWEICSLGVSWEIEHPHDGIILVECDPSHDLASLLA